MECRFVDVNQVCNQEKAVPAEWITGDGNDIGEKFIQYALPLIQGEPERIMENGFPNICTDSNCLARENSWL